MIKNPFSLEGKTILVTGASSGIGRAIAVECSNLGAKMVITGRNSVRLEETFRLMRIGEHLIKVADLNLSQEVEKLVETMPIIDGLVHNAGINKQMVCKFVKPDDMHAILGTNLEAPIFLQKDILKKRKIKGGGSIIFVSSMASFMPTIGNAVYSASKAAITAYSKVLALELAPQKIRVNCIHPGMVRTDLINNLLISSEQHSQNEKKYPLGRYGTPEDIAYLSVYLLSDASSWMTGSSITIDGGSGTLGQKI